MNLETIIDTLPWYKIWQLNGFNLIRAKPKLLRRQKRAYKSSWSRRGNQKSFTLSILWNLARPVKIFPGIIVRQHLTVQKQVGLLREQCAELRKGPLQYCCNQVWMKNGGQIPWNAIPICETFKISCLMGRHLMRGDSANHSKDRLFRLARWSNFTLFLPKTCRDCISSARKSHQEYFSVMYLHAGESGKETLWSQTLRTWKRWTHVKSTLGDSMQRKCYRRKELKNIPSRRWNSQNLWGRTASRDRPERGEEQEILQGESDGSSPPPQDSLPDAGEAINDFWSISGNFKNRHHVEPRVKLYPPREESFPIPLRYIVVTRATSTKLRSIYFMSFMDPEDTEFKENPANARKVGVDDGISHACIARFETTSAGNRVAKNPTLADLNVHASLKLMSLRDSAWKKLCQKIMRIALLGRDATR